LFRVAIASFFKYAACADPQVSPWSVPANPSSTIPSPIDRADLDPRRESRASAASRERWSTIMPDPLAGLPPRYLRTPEAARWLGLSGRTLEKHRIYGTGPVYRKIGGRVVYRVDDLQRWVDKGIRTSTSDPGTDAVLPPKRTAL
jgi:helix-turn-helix protein